MSKQRVLVCDDEPSLLRLLQVTLEIEGYDVSLASDGETALRRVEQESPDVLLLDIMMPVMDGWQVLERLQAFEKKPRVICLSAKTTRRDLSRGWRLGADEYVEKPFEVDELLELIPEVIGRTRKEQEARRERALQELGQD